MSIKGYKVFNPDWTCRDFKYEVGKTYKHHGDIEIYKAGFHFCRKASDCFCYYCFDINNHVAKVEAVGLIKSDGDKSVTDEIRIIREVPWQELLNIVNEGKGCTGLKNVGNYNVGKYNTGSWNTGDCNTGSWNNGNNNAGHCNIGNSNAGDWNAGNNNTGNYNTGNCNMSNFNTGFFCTDTPKIRAFNKQTDIDYTDFLRSKGYEVFAWNYKDSWWIYSQNMSDEEKSAHPEYVCTGGYLKTVDYKTACAMMWKKLSAEDRKAVIEMPYFDADIFKEITGIDVGEPAPVKLNE